MIIYVISNLFGFLFLALSMFIQIRENAALWFLTFAVILLILGRSK